MERLRKVIEYIGRVEVVVGGILLLFMVVLITLQVILRSVFNNPFSWMEEAVTYTLVWLTFVGASIGLKQLRHVTIVTFVSKMDAERQNIFRLVADVIIVWLLVMLIIYSYQIIPIEGSATTVALPIDLPRAVFFSAALFVISILMSITMCYYTAADLLAVLGKRKTGKEAVLKVEEDETSPSK